MANENTAKLQSLINSLPKDLQHEVLDFAEFLVEKKKKENEHKKPRKAGFLKGIIKIKKDFYKPLEDFKEYM